MNSIPFWHFISERLSKSQPVILLCVVDSHGSSPGRKGFKMAVASDGLSGSIGGGIMEHKFVEMAREKLNFLPEDPLIKRQIHSKEAKKNQSGMICSGEQTIVLFHLTKIHLPVISQIILNQEKSRSGTLKISPEEILFFENKNNDNDSSFELISETEWTYQDFLGYKNHLCIIGGGHCALALSKLMSSMDFYIHLYEERKELNTFEQNFYVQEKILVNGYEDLSELLPEGKNIFTVIMTFGYRTDNIALRSIIHKHFGYLGILGSKSKMSKMFDEWRKDNLPEEKLNKIFAPIGLSINSRTPEEIAVSIAAEIISVKNK